LEAQRQDALDNLHETGQNVLPFISFLILKAGSLSRIIIFVSVIRCRLQRTVRWRQSWTLSLVERSEFIAEQRIIDRDTYQSIKK
jgi:hypothetical protein